MTTLIGPDNTLALLTCLLALAWTGFWAESHPIARKIPGVVWVLTLGTILANLGVVPFEAPVYGIVFGYLMPMAVPLLLFKATFTKILRDSGQVLPIFLLGALAVCIGGLVSYVLYDLGPVEPKVTAAYIAAWVGGVVNLVALSEMTRMTPEEFSIALGASSPVSLVGLALLVMLPSIAFVRRHIPSKIIDAQGEVPVAAAAAEPVPLQLSHIVGALALSAAVCAVSSWMIASGLFPESWEMDRYKLFIITIITIVIANVVPDRMAAIKGEFEVGMFLMYLFFAAIGVSTDAVTFLTQAPVYFMFGMTIIVVHLVLMVAFGMIFKFDLAELVIGSGANIVGAAPSAGIASSRGWKHLVTPAIATGMLGYAIANFLGMAIFRLLT